MIIEITVVIDKNTILIVGNLQVMKKVWPTKISIIILTSLYFDKSLFADEF